MEKKNSNPSPLYGLVLVGGQSSRMGKDKASLSYRNGKSQLEQTVDLLNGRVDRVFVSQRLEQAYLLPDGINPIYDNSDKAKGPLCGILSAMEKFPYADWLVLACDLPLLASSELERLIVDYRSHSPALTAFRSSFDGLPEPLCAIYPAGSDLILSRRASMIGKFCPRKLLILEKARLVDLENPRSLDNINTPDEAQELKGLLS